MAPIYWIIIKLINFFFKKKNVFDFVLPDYISAGVLGQQLLISMHSAAILGRKHFVLKLCSVIRQRGFGVRKLFFRNF